MIDKLAFIFIRNKKLLSTMSKNKDTFYIPGGKREEGESDENALIREIREELSVDLISETLSHYGVFSAQAHGKQGGTIVKMTCYTGEFEGILKPAAEIKRTAWLTSKDIDKVSPVDVLIMKDLKNKGLID